MELNGLNVALYRIEIFLGVIAVSVVFYIIFRILYFRRNKLKSDENYSELKKEFENIKAQLLLVIKQLKKHEAAHNENEAEKKKIYKALTDAYDFQVSDYNIRKKSELSRFLYRKLKLINKLAEHLCMEIDYFNINFSNINNFIEDVRAEIYYYAEKISNEFAEENKIANQGIFSRGKYEIDEILKDELKNDKSSRILKVIKDIVSASTRISIETYFSYKKSKPENDKFSQLIRQNEFHLAACELLSTGKANKQSMEIISRIDDLMQNEVSGSLEYDKLTIEKNKIRSSLLKLNEMIKNL